MGLEGVPRGTPLGLGRRSGRSGGIGSAEPLAGSPWVILVEGRGV
jgi:hypothetical protein